VSHAYWNFVTKAPEKPFSSTHEFVLTSIMGVIKSSMEFHHDLSLLCMMVAQSYGLVKSASIIFVVKNARTSHQA